MHKFFGDSKADNGQPLYWQRAEDDGMPYRGRPPLYRSEDEYDDNVKTVADFKCELFNLEIQAEAERYRDVMDRSVNGWFRVIHIERMIKKESQLVYLEWVEYFKQDSKNPQKLQHTGAPQLDNFQQFKDEPNGYPQNGGSPV